MVVMNRRKKPVSKSPFVYGLGLLARREYSRQTLRQKMIDRGYEAEAAELALEELVADGWLDDYRYGAQLCRALIERGYGPQYIQQAWRQKGVSPSCQPREVLDAAQKAALTHALQQAAGHVTPSDGGAAETLSMLLAHYDDDFWCAQAAALVEKFTQTRWHASPADSLQAWRRAVSLLERRGYPNHCIRFVLGSPPRK